MIPNVVVILPSGMYCRIDDAPDGVYVDTGSIEAWLRSVAYGEQTCAYDRFVMTAQERLDEYYPKAISGDMP